MNIEVTESLKATDLCYIMNYYGSDKGSPEDTVNHSYTRLYSNLFAPVKNDPVRVFELGLGTNNTDMVSNMGTSGKPGASLRGWRHFFPNGQIFGADIDRRVLFTDERIYTFYCDQNVGETIREMWESPILAEEFDIIIEDGLHIFESNVNFFEHSYHKLKVGGVFVIEDIMYYNLDRFRAQIEEWQRKFPNLIYRLYTVPFKNNPYDNTVLLAQRIR